MSNEDIYDIQDTHSFIKLFFIIVFFLLIFPLGYNVNKLNSYSFSYANCFVCGAYLSLSFIRLPSKNIFTIIGFAIVLFVERVAFDAFTISFPSSNCDISNNDNEYFSSEEEDEVREHKIIRLFNAKQQNSKAEPDNGSNDNKKEDNKLFVKYFTASGKLVRSAKFIFNAKRIKKTEKAKEMNMHHMGNKINKEVFDETAISYDDLRYTHPKYISLCNKNTFISLSIITALSIHSFIEGLLIGILTHIPFTLIIWIRKAIEIIAISRSISQSKLNNEIFIMLLLFFCTMTPFGIIIGRNLQWMSTVVIGLSSGSLIYTSCVDIVIEEFVNVDNKEGIKSKFCLYLLGLLIFAIL